MDDCKYVCGVETSQLMYGFIKVKVEMIKVLVHVLKTDF